MLGLFGTLGLGSRALMAQRQGIEVTGHNIANANNPAYARQRLGLQTSFPIQTPMGAVGTGVEATDIIQIRNAFIDKQMQGEISVGGYLASRQQALQYIQANLGEQIDSKAAGVDGASSVGGVALPHGIGDEIINLFNAFQSVSLSPESLIERQALMDTAQSMALRFQQVNGNLEDLAAMLNDTLASNVGEVNGLLEEITTLNEQIGISENIGGRANDLRDLLQDKIEKLSKLVNVETSVNSRGTIDLAVGGVTVIQDKVMLDRVELYDAGGGTMMLRTVNGGTPLTLASGQIQGTIEVRDGALVALRTNLNQLATELINEVNALHRTGYALDGTTGMDFFSGTNASDIAVNSALQAKPSLVHAGGTVGATGDNQVALELAQLAVKKVGSLNDMTFAQYYGQIVADVGQELSSTNTQLEDHDIVQNLLARQRGSISGVSLEEEMTELIKYQKAFEASAKLIAVVDELLDTIMSIKR